jgi:HSP20 family protein
MPRWVEEFEDFSSQRGLRIHETDSDIVAEAVVAGVAKDDIDVNIEDGVLTVKAETKTESSAYQYYYTAALSGGQWDKASAKIKDGIVKVTIPKAEEVKPRKLAVEEDK